MLIDSVSGNMRMKRTSSFEIAATLLDEFGKIGDILNFDQKIIDLRNEVISVKKIRKSYPDRKIFEDLQLKGTKKNNSPVASASQISTSFHEFMSLTNNLWRQTVMDMNKTSAIDTIDKDVSDSLPKENSSIQFYNDAKEAFDSLPSNFETLLSVSESSSAAIVITECEHPFRIIDVNSAWVELCGYQKESVIGNTCRIIQSPPGSKISTKDTNEKQLRILNEKAVTAREHEVLLRNFKKSGEAFNNLLRIKPLYDNTGKCCSMLGVLTQVSE